MQKLFRGYVPTKNKECLMSFKGKDSSELKTLEEVQDLPEYAGVLEDGIVLIDIDDKDQSETMLDIIDDMNLNCKVFMTRRGKHFLFSNLDANGNYIIDKCGTHKTLACGLTADIKLGHKNSYEVLKYEGKDRFVEYDIEPEEEYDPLPKFMIPVSTKTDFVKMRSGDGRNQEMFNYILTLQSSDFSKDEARQVLEIINKYVLDDPLPAKELKTLSRDDAFQKPVFFKNNVFLFDKFAHYMASNYHIIKINGQLHIYKDGIYVDATSEIEAQMIKHISTLSRAKRAEVLSYLDILIRDDRTMSDANYIAFKNGIYNIAEDRLEPFTPDIIITNKINFDYNPKAYDALMDKTLDKMACFDPSVRALLEECIGYCFYRRNELRKCFILTGEKENGKSTYLSLIENLLGYTNITSLDLKELGDRFRTAQLVNKLACIGDDIGSEFIPNPSVFKKLASGNPITVEKKGKDPFDFSNYAKLLFSANDIPKIKDRSGAVISRLIIIPFDARFTPDDPDFDPYIKYKLVKPIPTQYLINIGIAGLHRVLANRRFTESAKVQDALQEYEENNNPILSFLKEEPKIENEPTTGVYTEYREFCLANNFSPMSNIEFSKQINRILGYKIISKSIKGKKYRVFVDKSGTV